MQAVYLPIDIDGEIGQVDWLQGLPPWERRSFDKQVMIAIIESYHEQIAELCRRYGVARLDVFGSATTERFAPGQSDVDFIVRFTNAESPGSARRFVGLAEALEQLLERPVDLLTDQPFANPYFAQSVAETRQIIYEQPDEKASV